MNVLSEVIEKSKGYGCGKLYTHPLDTYFMKFSPDTIFIASNQ